MKNTSLNVTLLVLCLGLWQAWNPASAQPIAYVANQGSQSVSVIDTTSNTVIGRIPVSASAPLRFGLSPDGATAYLTTGAGPLVVIDTPTHTEVLPTIPIVGSSFLALSPDGATAYITSGDTAQPGGVTLVDTATRSVFGVIPLANGNRGIAVTPDGRKAYVAQAAADFLWVLDLQANTVGSMTVEVESRPHTVAIDSSGLRAYVTNQNAGSVSVIDVATDTEIAAARIAVPGFPFSLTIRPDGLEMYVTNHATDAVDIVELASNTIVESVSVGEDPYITAFTPDSRFAYVTNWGSDDVYVIDTSTREVIQVIAVEDRPIGIAVLPAADSDGDSVLDDLDVCRGTVIPESVPTQRLGVNRWALLDEDGRFDTARPPGEGSGPSAGFSVAETAGCSCEQIIEALGLGQGHVKFGCSSSVMREWVALVNS